MNYYKFFNHLEKNQISKVIFDIDGTIVYDSVLCADAYKILTELDKRKIKFGFLSNDSSQTGKLKEANLLRLGINNVCQGVITSADLLSKRLERFNGKQILYIGIPAFELNENYNFVLDYSKKSFEKSDLIVWGEGQNLTIKTISTLITVLSNSNKKLLIVNPDFAYKPNENIFISAGSLAKLVENILSEVKSYPDIELIGKPSYNSFKLSHQYFFDSLDFSNTLFVGDSYRSDIKPSLELGMSVYHIETGFGAYQA